MRIIRLNAENFKKLKAVEITPTGELVEITGRNNAGKTSVLDSIWAALGGARHIQAMPIRKGATQARIRLDLGDLVVERHFTESGSTLTVENAQGARFRSPQTMLDALIGALAFDPLEFLNLDPRAQLAELRRIVPLEVDVDELDGLNRGDYDRRAEANKSAREARARGEGITVPDGLPGELIDTAPAMDGLTQASEFNTSLERSRAERAAAAQEIERLRQDAAAVRTRAEELRAQAGRLEQKASEEFDRKAQEIEARLRAAKPLPDPVDAVALRVELDKANETNRLILKAKERQAQLAAAAVAEERARTLTLAMEAREQAKADALAQAKMPVEGLGFGADGVTLNGLPFDQASSAEQLRVSVAIAMTSNPKLRVVRIKEGSLLDDENLALIATMARERDYQVWIERVNTSGKVGVVIEDGAVVAVDGKPVEAAAP